MATGIFGIDGVSPPPPDTDVRLVEDALETGMITHSRNGTGITKDFPPRPGYGTRGKRVELWTNYVDLKVDMNNTGLILYRYGIEVMSPVSGKKRNRLVWLFLNSTDLCQHKADIVSDLYAILISRKDLGPLTRRTFVVHYFDEYQKAPQKNAEQVQLRLNFEYTLPIVGLKNYVASQKLTKSYSEKSEMLQSLNIFLNHYSKASKNHISLGSNRTFHLNSGPSDKISLGVGIQGRRGFFTSVRPATNRVLINVNVNHSAFFMETPLVEVFRMLKQRFIASRKPRNDGGWESEEEAEVKAMQALHYFLRGINVLAQPPEDNTTTTIRKLSGLATPKDGRHPKRPQQHPPQVSKFGANSQEVEIWLSNATNNDQSAQSKGGYVKLKEVFNSKYDVEEPVVNSGTMEKPFYLHMAACIIIGNQPASSKLDEDQRQQMTKFSIRPPVDNAHSIVKQGLETVGLNPILNPLIKGWGFSAGNRLITVQGRQLEQPKIRYKSSTQINVRPDSSWNLLKSRFRSSKTLQKWSYLSLASGFDRKTLTAIMREFVNVLRQTGIGVVDPIDSEAIFAADVDDAARKLDAHFQDRVQKGVRLMFVVLSSHNSPYYNIVKRLGDMKHGVVTICMTENKLKKSGGRDQYMRNISMKVNLKLGGGNHAVDSTRHNLLSPDNTMIVGLDVTHPSPGSDPSAPSIAAMVASVDAELGQWPAVLNTQKVAREEMVSGLAGMLESRIKLWGGKNNRLPDNILVYRDGVSEGQYKIVIDKELPDLRKACIATYGDSYKEGHRPRLTILIVGKRHHTRFYPTMANDALRGNTKPGTVVDRGVTEGQNWDFHLQAHSPIQGTARPSHQFVLLDEIFRAKYSRGLPKGYSNVADVVEEVTHALCYTFGRATRAVSICTPAYYADLACERARRYFDFLYAPATHGVVPFGAASSSSSGGTNNRPDIHRLKIGENVRIHDNLKDCMFYI